METGSWTLKMLNTAFEDSALKGIQVYEWHKSFHEVRDSTEDDAWLGRPATACSTTDNVKPLVNADHHLTIREISGETGLGFRTFQTVDLNEKSLCKVCAIPTFALTRTAFLWSSIALKTTCPCCLITTTYLYYTRHIYQIWLPVTSGYFQRWSLLCKGPDLTV